MRWVEPTAARLWTPGQFSCSNKKRPVWRELGAPSSILVTTSKALVTSSDALVTSSFLLLVVRHLLLGWTGNSKKRGRRPCANDCKGTVNVRLWSLDRSELLLEHRAL